MVVNNLIQREDINMEDKKKKKNWKVAKVMREFLHRTLHIGKSNKKVRSHDQAIAIGLSEQRKENNG